MISITFEGYNGTLSVYEDGPGKPISVWVGDKDECPNYLITIEEVNGKHPVFGLWESYLQNDDYAMALRALDIHTVEVE